MFGSLAFILLSLPGLCCRPLALVYLLFIPWIFFFFFFFVYREGKILQWSLQCTSWVHADSSLSRIIVPFNCSHVPDWIDSHFFLIFTLNNFRVSYNKIPQIISKPEQVFVLLWPNYFNYVFGCFVDII